ncbi:hypothetical protein U9M48_038735 [Paspalum notatum var. saurae]|uniref:Uncharacterized protein n=1 Tax=Paspalum notatum var. saurae TaxID=547442 RepID=A0AAQ3UJ59_PASNO
MKAAKKKRKDPDDASRKENDVNTPSPLAQSRAVFPSGRTAGKVASSEDSGAKERRHRRHRQKPAKALAQTIPPHPSLRQGHLSPASTATHRPRPNHQRARAPRPQQPARRRFRPPTSSPRRGSASPPPRKAVPAPKLQRVVRVSP